MAEGLIGILVFILILGLIIGLCVYLIDLMPFIPAEFKAAAKAIIIVVGIIILLVKLLPLANIHL
jgi:hypothetical protein